MFFGILILSGILFLSCNEKDLINEEDNNLFVLKNGNDSLMNDSVVQLMLAELDDYNIQINNNILQFETAIDFNDVLDILIKYDSLVENKDNYPRDPALVAFENHYGFASLRADITDEVSRVEQNGGITEYNDPDNFHVVSPYFRTLLTPECDIIIYDTIYVVLEGYSLYIVNYDFTALDETHDNIETYGSTQGANFSNLFGNVGMVLEGGSICSADFSFEYINNNSLDIQFWNLSSGGAVGSSLTYEWNFGDNSSISNTKHPSHTYALNGTYVVNLDVWTAGILCDSKQMIINVGQCTANFTFIEDIEIKGKYHFTNTSTILQGIVDTFKWDFGDGLESTEENPIHEFVNGYFNVKLKIITNYNCIDEYDDISITVTNSETCCKWWDREKIKYIYYDNDNRRIKHVFKIRNLPFYHKIIAKTSNYEYSNFWNGFILSNADIIKASFGAVVWTEFCTEHQGIGIYEDVDENNVKACIVDGQGEWFRLKKNGGSSSYYVNEDGLTVSEINALLLHDGDCD